MSDDGINGVLLKALQSRKICCVAKRAVHEQRLDALLPRELGDLAVKAFPRFHERCHDVDERLFSEFLDRAQDGADALLLDRDVAVRAILGAAFRKEQPQEMINFRDRRDRAFSTATRNALLNGDGGRHA